MKKIKTLTAILMCIFLFTTGVFGYESVDVRLDGKNVPLGALLIGATTYVPFDTANKELSGGSADIYGSAEKMSAVTPFAEITANAGDCYIEAEGRYFGGSNALVISGMLYVPIRSIAKAYGASVEWDEQTRSVDIYSESRDDFKSGNEYYDSDAVYWLSRIINAEAGGESMEGKIMVGNVILNRVESHEFPNTIYGVIFDTEYGVQFTPTVNGTVYNTPSEDSIIAAKICLDSYYLSRSAMYFLNPEAATNFWVPANRPYLTTIGCHDFYS